MPIIQRSPTCHIFTDHAAQTFRNVINNELTSTEETRRAVDPSTGLELAEVPISTQDDVDRAVAAAQAAFPAWRDLSQDERAAYLTTLVDSFDAHQKEFAELLGKEAGKPPQAVGLELFLLSHQIRETLKFRLTEEQIENTDEVCFCQKLSRGHFRTSVYIHCSHM